MAHKKSFYFSMSDPPTPIGYILAKPKSFLLTCIATCQWKWPPAYTGCYFRIQIVPQRVTSIWGASKYAFTHARVRLQMEKNFLSNFWIKTSRIINIEMNFFQKANLSIVHLTNPNLNLNPKPKTGRVSNGDDGARLVLFIPHYPHERVLLYLTTWIFLSSTGVGE